MLHTPNRMVADRSGTDFDSEAVMREHLECGLVTVADHMGALGKPENVGHGFAVTRLWLRHHYSSDLKRLLDDIPADFDHAVYLDAITENALVIRPNADGQYAMPDGKPFPSEWKRLR